MDPRELALWRADYEIEPWGELRADRRAAAMVEAILTAGDRSITMAAAMDHVNPWRKGAEPRAKPSPAQVKKMVRLFNASLTGGSKGKASK